MNTLKLMPELLDGALSPQELDILDNAFEPAQFAAGTCIFRAGDPGDGFYVVEQGEIRVELGEQEHVDTDRVLGYVTPGWLLGELAVLDAMPRSASAFAETAVVAHWLSTARMQALGKEHPQIGIALLRMLGRNAATRLRRSDRRIAEHIAGSAEDPEIDRTVARSVQAQRAFESWSEPRVDALLLALAQAMAANAEALAKATVAETRIGNVPDKTTKNLHASLGVYQFLAGKPGIGVIAEDAERHVTEIASPAGVIFGIVPITNPVATAIFKTLIALKARCSIILSFPRGCLGIGNTACEIMDRVLTEHGAPAHLMQWIRQRSSRGKTAGFMRHDGVSLILATGGSGMVTAAYRSGTPALGVGPGNTPVYVADDADVEAAAFCITISKPYDNGLICGAEHNLVVDASVHDAFVDALTRHGAAVLDPEEAKRFAAQAIQPDGGKLIGLIIGQAAQRIADVAGIKRPYPIKVIVVPAPVEAVEQDSPFAKEKLAPLLSLFTIKGEAEALTLCRRILDCQGAGHTAIVHTRSPERANRFGLVMPASRILVNAPGVQGISGIATGLIPSYTLGCGTFGGNSTTDNVSFRHLQNIKRLAQVVAQPQAPPGVSAPSAPPRPA